MTALDVLKEYEIYIIILARRGGEESQDYKKAQIIIDALKKQIATPPLDEIRAEAIKEFAEKVKASRDALFNTIHSGFYFNVIIDTLVKEMKEGK